MLKEFKEFAMKGNLVDIAVAFVMGAAFNKVVTSFTGGIVSPLVGLIFNSDFKDLKYVITEGVANDTGEITGEVSVLYPLLAMSYVWVSLLSIWFLGEVMTSVKWMGVMGIILGVSFIGIGGTR